LVFKSSFAQAMLKGEAPNLPLLDHHIKPPSDSEANRFSMFDGLYPMIANSIHLNNASFLVSVGLLYI